MAKSTEDFLHRPLEFFLNSILLKLDYPRECGKTIQLLHEAEHLQADGWHDDEEASCEHHQTA